MKQNIVEQFRNVVISNLNKIAIIHNYEEISYSELETRSNLYARLMKDRGVEAGDYVILSNRRTTWSYAAIIAIIKLNAVYVPLNIGDIGYVSRIMNSMKAKMFILYFDEIEAINNVVPDANILVHEDLYDLKKSDEELFCGNVDAIAYVCYTSGTTGKPKGVLIKQKGILSLIEHASYFSFCSSDVIGQTSTMEFDAFTFEFWGALLSGATLCVVDKYILLSPNDFAGYILQKKINKLFLTTSLFNSYGRNEAHIFNLIDVVVAGGDVMDAEAVNSIRKINRNIRIVNGYGPTENTTFSTVFELDKEVYYEEIPIGKPCKGDVAYILRNDYTVCGENEEGVIYVGGEGVAVGYLHNEKLTRKLFIPDPISGNGMVYNSGDMGYYDEKGDIHFCGRKDEQVKVSGYRIELNHIKCVAEHLQDVNKAEVILHKSPDGKSIVLFVEGECKDRRILQDRLGKELPKYMLPNEIVILEGIPYKTSGKPDKGKLRDIYIAEKNIAMSSAEDELVEILKKFIPCIDDEEVSFFDSGLSSLSLADLSRLLSDSLGIEISIVDIFTNYNISLLRRFIQERREAEL